MKLIDILNLISKGELKEGTKIKWENDIYTYDERHCFERENGCELLEDMYVSNLNDECELIEPDKDIDVSTTEKIKELDFYDYDYEDLEDYRTILTITDKLNEVIRRINNVR